VACPRCGGSGVVPKDLEPFLQWIAIEYEVEADRLPAVRKHYEDHPPPPDPCPSCRRLYLRVEVRAGDLGVGRNVAGLREARRKRA
jgi:hypothetical protein